MRRTPLLLALSLLTATLAAVAAPATAQPPPASATTIRWSPCYPELGPFECATLQVPYDYDDPGRTPVQVALVRLPASSPDERIGSILINPGGPGGSGVDFVLAAGPVLYSDEVRARFDLVGFDPRGIVRSTPLRCFRSIDQAAQVLAVPFAFPYTSDEEELWEQSDLDLVEACDRNAGPIIDHMATANVARDMDSIRQALGEDRLNFVGYSYGSMIGVTYANLFPDRVGSLVIDGILDPIAWTTGTGDEAETIPISLRLHSADGSHDTLDEFFRLCDENPDTCAFSGDAAERFADLAAGLLAEPIELVNPITGDLVTFIYQDLIAISLGAMYNSASWPFFAAFLADLEAAATPAALGTSLQAVWAEVGLVTQTTGYENVFEGFAGVVCSDSDNPDDHDDWSAANGEADSQSVYFGRLWSWISSICAVWNAADADRYTGPWGAATANPVLVVGTLFDPATPYHGAELVRGLLPNSSLLTVAGWGHTSLFLSACADQAVSDYLLTGVPPADGTVCTQDFGPFEVVPASVLAARAAGEAIDPGAARAAVMDEIALYPQR